MRIVNIEDIVPGKIFYHVYGVSAIRCKDAALGAKIITTSTPYKSKHAFAGFGTDSLLFNCIEVHDSFERRNGYCYISDCGLGESVYNLNRLFHTKEDAEDFIEQCKVGVFKDPKDQEYYDSAPKIEVEDMFLYEFEEADDTL